MSKSVKYVANIQRGIDTSGMLILDYGDFKAVLIAAKDCAAPVTSLIEGEDGTGTIVVNGPANVMDSFDIYQGQKRLHMLMIKYIHTTRGAS